MNQNTRITLEMSTLEALMAVAEGNPGALHVLMVSMEQSPSIDPDSAFGPFAPILSFDTHGIYGPRVWMLFKDVCGQSMTHMLAVLRAVQLGLMPEREMLDAIDSSTRLDTDDILKRVQEKLPEFAAKVPS